VRESCPSDLTAQCKAEKLIDVPSISDGFRAAVSALRSLDVWEAVSFHTFSLLEGSYVRLLVKNFGTRMPESVVREELESLNINIQEICSSDLATATRIPPMTALSQLSSSYYWRVDLICSGYDLSPSCAVCECWWRRSCTKGTTEM
jgi:hypothetical protein